MRIALVQINPIIGDFSYNSEKIVSWANRAREKGCDLAIFPELALCGYPPQDLLERPKFLADHDMALHDLINGISGIGIICGHLEKHTDETGKPLHNSASVIENGSILFTAQKRLLPTYDVFDESRYFEPGRSSQSYHYKEGLRMGLTVCEDIWNDKGAFPQKLYATDPINDLVTGLHSEGGKIDLLINISASPFQIDKETLKKETFTRVCRNNNVSLIYVNQVGGQDSLLFDGCSMAINSNGNIIAKAERFKEDMVVLDTEWLGEMHGQETLEVIDTEPKHEEPDSFLQEAAIVHDALVMGVRDYAQKCGFSKGVVGLSGGIDSAVTCAIACEAFGAENTLGVAMPSPYTSDQSVEDAKQLAANLGCPFEIIAISSVFAAMKESLENTFIAFEKNVFRKIDVTEQNIQARIRGNLLMALSNKDGSLLLSTGNKSEMAVGYCTLYGDMSGGLAVISDVPKLLVYKLAQHINRHKEIIPESIIARPPSAELAPDQLDQDDLPPYDILDAILKAYLEQNLSVGEIAALGFDRQVVQDVVRRIRVNEYKRKQAPLGLKVSSKAFGYGRRYPTAQNYRDDGV
jgi:NAD+ synthetase